MPLYSTELLIQFYHSPPPPERDRIPAPHIVAARAYRVTPGAGPTGSGALPALFAAAASSSIASAAAAAASSASSSTNASSSAAPQQLSPTTAAGALPLFGYASSAYSGSTTTMTNSLMMGSTINPSSTEKTPLYRLAKLLNQTRIGGSVSGPSTMVLKDDAPRRLSWER